MSENDPRTATATLPFALNQPLLLDKSATHLRAVTDAALASVLAHHARRDLPVWASWHETGFAKVARRATSATLDAVVRDHQGVRHGSAVALTPLAPTDQPRLVAKAQVAGTDFPREESANLEREATVSDLDTHVEIHLLDALTTGKAAAQAAHALGLLWLSDLTGTAGPEFLRWLDNGAPLTIRLTPPKGLALHATKRHAVIVQDAGRSEVEPGTVTAVAWKR